MVESGDDGREEDRNLKERRLSSDSQPLRGGA